MNKVFEKQNQLNILDNLHYKINQFNYISLFNINNKNQQVQLIISQNFRQFNTQNSFVNLQNNYNRQDLDNFRYRNIFKFKDNSNN